MNSTKYPEPLPLNDVAEFHKTFSLPILESPGIPAPERCMLRVNLLQEELDELKDAIGENSIAGIADALSDIQYVLSGAILEFGLADRFKQLFEEVQRSNMSKVCPDYETAQKTVDHYLEKDGTKSIIQQNESGYLVYRESDKKVLKSIQYSPADLESILGIDSEIAR